MKNFYLILAVISRGFTFFFQFNQKAGRLYSELSGKAKDYAEKLMFKLKNKADEVK